MEVSQIDQNYNGCLIAIDDIGSYIYNLIVDTITGELLLDTDDASYIIFDNDHEHRKTDENYYEVYAGYDEDNNEIRPIICSDFVDGSQDRTMSLLCECDNVII